MGLHYFLPGLFDNKYLATINKLYFFVTGYQVIIKNGIEYLCYGRIFNSGYCKGRLVRLNPTYSGDFCFSHNSYSIVQNHICLGATSVEVINNSIHCYNSYKLPVLLMHIDDFNKMCKNLSQKVLYKYIADPSNPKHVEIPNQNTYVHCENNDRDICIFSESNILDGSNSVTQISSSNSNQQTYVSNVNVN